MVVDIAAFNVVVTSALKFSKEAKSRFVKKEKEIPKIEMCAPRAHSFALQLDHRGLID